MLKRRYKHVIMTKDLCNELDKSTVSIGTNLLLALSGINLKLKSLLMIVT